MGNGIKATQRILFQNPVPVLNQSLPSPCPLRGPPRWVPAGTSGCEGLGARQGRAWVGVPGQGGGLGAQGQAMMPGTPASGGCRFPPPPAPTGVTASCQRASAGGCGKGQGRGGALLHPSSLLLRHPGGREERAAMCPHPPAPSNEETSPGRAQRLLNRQDDGSLPPPAPSLPHPPAIPNQPWAGSHGCGASWPGWGPADSSPRWALCPHLLPALPGLASISRCWLAPAPRWAASGQQSPLPSRGWAGGTEIFPQTGSCSSRAAQPGRAGGGCPGDQPGGNPNFSHLEMLHSAAGPGVQLVQGCSHPRGAATSWMRSQPKKPPGPSRGCSGWPDPSLPPPDPQTKPPKRQPRTQGGWGLWRGGSGHS